MGLFGNKKEPKDTFYNADNIEYERELSMQEFPTVPVDENAEEAEKYLKALQKPKENSEKVENYK